MRESILVPAHAMTRWVACAGLVLAALGAGCAAPTTGDCAAGDGAGAMVEPGLPRLRQVDQGLYRGGQPTTHGLRRLEAMGIRTVVCLRTTDVNAHRRYGTSMAYMRIPMSPWRPRDADVIAFLKLATDPAHAPLFVHCERGCDRTGMMCAMYRVVVQDWSRDRAIAEMTRHGMGFHDVYQNLIDYVRDADVERIRREIGAARIPTIETARAVE